MKITFTDKFSNTATPIFLLNEGENTTRHPFFRLLKKDDQEHLSAFQKKSEVRAGNYRLTLLPRGLSVLLVGLPEKSKHNHRKSLLAARQAVAASRTERLEHIAIHLRDFAAPEFSGSDAALAEIIATQFEIANFEFVKYKTPPAEGWFFVKKISVLSDRLIPHLAQHLATGKIIGEEINHARTLSNTPGGDMTPDALAKAAKDAGKRCGFKVNVLGEKEIERLGMGGIIGVSRGSAERPHFIIMEYTQGRRSEKPIVLIGKGVTFDSGGLNLKPEEGFREMHMDMSGGAAVIHTIAALARLRIKKNVTGLVPAVENMPSGSSFHPGDLLKTISRKTIEVLNTDAEGRIIVADALGYAERYKPRLVVDVATLTGAAMAALGQRASALFTTDDKLEKQLRAMGDKTGDFVWPLPLWEEFEEDIKGTFGDVANAGKTKYGGAITGAVFLWQFIKEYPWVHIDIAPRMTSIEGEFLAKGAAGAAINLLVHFLQEFK